MFVFGSLWVAASAILQFQCGALDGQGYYAPENRVPKAGAGWSEASNSGESIVRVNLENGELGYQFKDATGVWKSPLDDGGKVSLLSLDEADASLQFLVTYTSGNTVEIVTMTEIETGTPKMIIAQSRNGPAFTSSSVMVATCAKNAP